MGEINKIKQNYKKNQAGVIKIGKSHLILTGALLKRKFADVNSNLRLG